jgi:membrane-associated phospholipid phosphatase
VPVVVVALCVLAAAPVAYAQTDPLPANPLAPTMNATMNGAAPAEPLSGWASKLWTDGPGLAPDDTAAQAPPAEKPRAHVGVKSLLRGILSDFAHLPTKQNLPPLIVGGAAAFAVYPADRSINAHLAGKGWVHDAFYPGKILGYGPFDVGAALGTYIIGRKIHNNKVAHIGVDLLRAQTVNIVVTYAIKEAVRRERPDGSGPTSFPSGHASTIFATASVLAVHFGWKWELPTYAIGAYVAASRLHENVHYASDVVFGAAVGYIVGHTVTRHGRSNFAVAPVRVPGGFAVLFVRAGR